MSLLSPFISVGPTVQFASVRRFAAFLLLAGSPTPGTVSVGPTVQFASVRRFAAFLLLAGSPTLAPIRVGPSSVQALLHLEITSARWCFHSSFSPRCWAAAYLLCLAHQRGLGLPTVFRSK